MGCYVEIEENSFFLKRIFVGLPDLEQHITAAEITFAEDWATSYIDGRLCRTFPCLPDTPIHIQEIALDLASWKLRKMVIAGNSPNEDEHTEELFDKADRFLTEIKEGTVCLVDPSGEIEDTLDLEDAPSESERRFFTQINRSFVEMEHLTDKEAPENEEMQDKYYKEEGVGASDEARGC